MTIHSAVVSQVVPVGFADMAHAADRAAGGEVSAGRVRLSIHGPVGEGMVGAIRFGATMRTGAHLPGLKVEVVVSPWSTGRSEVAIHPMSNLGHFDSMRARRFFRAARCILPVVLDRLYAELPVEAPAAQLVA